MKNGNSFMAIGNEVWKTIMVKVEEGDIVRYKGIEVPAHIAGQLALNGELLDGVIVQLIKK